MNKLLNLEYSDLENLLTYLYEISDSEDEEEKVKIAINKIGRFFPTMTASQELAFSSICEMVLLKESPVELYETFKVENPDIEVDPEGRSTPNKKNYWEIQLKSLDMTYHSAYNTLKEEKFIDSSYNKINSQVYNAKTLACLINMKQCEKPYIYNREIFLKKNTSDVFSHNIFHNVEEALKKHGIQTNVLNQLIEYCSNKKEEKYKYFVKHLFSRIEILGKDDTLTNIENQKFLEKLREIA